MFDRKEALLYDFIYFINCSITLGRMQIQMLVKVHIQL